MSESEISACFEFELNRRLKKMGLLVEMRNSHLQEEDKIPFMTAADLVLQYQVCSRSFLEKKLKISYAKSQRIVAELEELGIVGPFEGSLNREVKVHNADELERLLSGEGLLSEKCKIFQQFYLPLYEEQIEKKCAEKQDEYDRELLRNQLLAEERKRQERARMQALREEVERELSESGAISLPASSGREPIPQDVMDAVWNRDGGKCVRCGKSEKLEFDHIIPVSKGGASTYRNLQLLCENCNRTKSDKIG